MPRPAFVHPRIDVPQMFNRLVEQLEDVVAAGDVALHR